VRRMRVAVALLVLTAGSVLLRTGALDAGFWIDEAIAVGIASHDLREIPALLRQDGSPPLYYYLLHGWMAVAGDGESATRWLSLLFAALAVPVAWWAAAAAGGRRAGAIGAGTAAVCPFLAYYAQETRMYTLVAALSLAASGAFALAFLRGRRGHLVTLAVSLLLLLYTHTWGVFLAAALALAWLGLWRAGRVDGRGGALVGAAVALLYVPWLPSLTYQALHTGAPWSARPSVLYLLAALVPAVAATRRGTPEVARLLAAVVSVGVAFGWLVSQIEPAWAPRYLAVLYGPALVALACGLAWRPRWLTALPAALVATWLLAGPAPAKSNARAVAVSVGVTLRAGDLVVCTQPEQIPVLHRYLPPGVRYLTPLGSPADPSFTDWRDAVRRVRAATARRVLIPRLRGLEPGRRIVLVTPVGRRPRAPWGRAVRLRTREWRAALRADSRLRSLGRTSRPDPARFRSTVRAEIFQVLR
jgi:mannosyltransferase